MSHSNAKFEEEDLSALLDGELSPAEAASLRARISEDPALQAEYDALAEARAFMGEHGVVAAPVDLLADILAAAEAEDDQGNVVQLAWYKRPLGVPVAGWAVAAAALLVVYVALPNFEGGAPDGARVNTAARAPMKKAEKQVVEEPVAQQLANGTNTLEPATKNEANDDGVAQVELPSKKMAPMRGQDKSSYSDKSALKLPKAQALDIKADSTEEKVVEPVSGSGTGEVPEGEGVGFAQVPYQYTLFTEDSEALMQLAAIAGRYRGEVAGPNDSVLELEELQGSEAATVVVKIPAHALQDFGKAINGLGNVYSSADNRVFAGDPVEVRVKVQLSAGKNPPSKGKPNAARLKQNAADDLVEQAL